MLDGTEQLLFSIEDRKSGPNNGDLYLSFATPQYFEDGMTGELEKAGEHRVSIHVTPSSSGHQINDHLYTDDVGHRYASAYVDLKNSHPIWLISCHCPAYSPHKPPFQKKSRDKVRQLAIVNGKLHTFVYLIWISRNDLPELMCPFPQIIENFSYFRVSLMTHKMCVPTSDEGFSSFFATSPRQTNGVPDDRVFGGNLEGLSPVEAQERNFFALHRASLNAYRKLKRSCKAEGFDLSSLPHDPRYFCCMADNRDAPRTAGLPDQYPIANPFHPDFSLPVDPPIRSPKLGL